MYRQTLANHFMAYAKVSKDSIRHNFMERMANVYTSRKGKKSRGRWIENRATREFQLAMYQGKFPVSNWAPAAFFHPSSPLASSAQSVVLATYARKPHKLLNTWQVRRNIDERNRHEDHLRR